MYLALGSSCRVYIILYIDVCALRVCYCTVTLQLLGVILEGTLILKDLNCLAV